MLEVDVSNLINASAGNCTVGFVDSEGSPALPLGSGTLIRFGPIEGILTCAHVLRALSKRVEVGVVVFCRTKPQGLKIRLRDCEMTVLEGEEWSSAGPDIGFLLLPSEAAELLGGYASFANGDKHRLRFISQQPECSSSFFSVVGGVAEWTTHSGNSERSLTVFGGLSNIGTIQRANGADGFDFYEFTATPERNFKMPKSYEGVSGGGLWKFFVKDTATDCELIEARLLGVAFYQNDGKVVCHGPLSIYRELYPKLPLPMEWD